MKTESGLAAWIQERLLGRLLVTVTAMARFVLSLSLVTVTIELQVPDFNLWPRTTVGIHITTGARESERARGGAQCETERGIRVPIRSMRHR